MNLGHFVFYPKLFCIRRKIHMYNNKDAQVNISVGLQFKARLMQKRRLKYMQILHPSIDKANA